MYRRRYAKYHLVFRPRRILVFFEEIVPYDFLRFLLSYPVQYFISGDSELSKKRFKVSFIEIYERFSFKSVIESNRLKITITRIDTNLIRRSEDPRDR